MFTDELISDSKLIPPTPPTDPNTELTPPPRILVDDPKTLPKLDPIFEVAPNAVPTLPKTDPVSPPINPPNPPKAPAMFPEAPAEAILPTCPKTDPAVPPIAPPNPPNPPKAPAMFPEDILSAIPLAVFKIPCKLGIPATLPKRLLTSPRIPNTPTSFSKDANVTILLIALK